MTLAVPSVAEYIARAESVLPVVRDTAEESRRLRHLAPKARDAFQDAGLFRIQMPVELGGGALTVFEAARVFEVISRVDASSAWSLALVASTTMFTTMLDPAVTAELLADPEVRACGSIQPTGIHFTPVAGGFEVEGLAKFVSGCHVAHWIVAGGVVLEAGGYRRQANGLPLVLCAVLPMERCRIVDNWAPSGLAGTGSHDVAIPRMFVEERLTFDIDDTTPRPGDPFPGVPLVSKLGPGVASVALGGAAHAVDAFVELANTKQPFGTTKPLRERPLAQVEIGRAWALVDAARASLQFAGANLREAFASGRPVGTAELTRLRAAYVRSAACSVEAVDVVHRLAGSSTLAGDSAIDQCWRDVHAASQHIAIAEQHYERIGQHVLGMI